MKYFLLLTNTFYRSRFTVYGFNDLNDLNDFNDQMLNVKCEMITDLLGQKNSEAGTFVWF